MSKSLFWASTHPAWSINGYLCSCGNLSQTMPEHYQHVLANHEQTIAREILSDREYKKYCKVKNCEYK